MGATPIATGRTTRPAASPHRAWSAQRYANGDITEFPPLDSIPVDTAPDCEERRGSRLRRPCRLSCVPAEGSPRSSSPMRAPSPRRFG